MVVNNNRDFLFLFDTVMSNPNGDPDQENKPRMDYETNTLLVSDARRKRDVRELIKTKGYPIFVDTLADNKVSMKVMFDKVIDDFMQKNEKTKNLFDTLQEERIKNAVVLSAEKVAKIFNELEQLVNATEICLKGLNQHIQKRKELLKNSMKKAETSKLYNEILYKLNNELMTNIVKESLIDIRWFGSAMAVEGHSRTYTGPIQLNWGYSLHPVELVQSSTISSIMSDDSSTFGKKYKVYYALIAHYGTVSKRNAEKTGMTDNGDLELFRKALVQGMMNNQTDSKQGQSPLLYLEIVYKTEFDGYLGDLRRFIKIDYQEEHPIRKLTDLQLDFTSLIEALDKVKDKCEKVLLWMHPAIELESLKNLPNKIADKILVEEKDLFESIPVRDS